MSTQNDRLDFSQPAGDNNQLSFYAEQQRSKLFPRNDFNTKNQYGPTNKDALSDGDNMGRGTGGFLDVNNDKIIKILTPRLHAFIKDNNKFITDFINNDFNK